MPPHQSVMGCTDHAHTVRWALPELVFALLSPGDLVVLDGAPTAGWLQGRNCWGARGFFPASCAKELCLSSRSQRWHSQSALLQLPDYSMGQARALMGLSAQLDEELDFREGDVITIIGVPEPGWFEGELEGRRGIFPEGFVELLGPLRTVEEPVDSGDDHVVNGKKVEPVDQRPEQESDQGSEQPGTYGIALYRFQALEPNELDFEVGDKIQILETLDDGWLKGSLRGRTGVFPYRFVKVYTEAPAEESPEGKQAPGLPISSEASPGPSENSSGAEEERSARDWMEKPPQPTLEAFASTPPDALLSSSAEAWEDERGPLALPPRSPASGHMQPLSKVRSTEDLPQVVNGVSSQHQAPCYPQLQKKPHFSTVGGSPLHPEDPDPLQVKTRDYSSLPARKADTLPRTRLVPSLNQDTLLSATWIGRAGNHRSPLLPSRCAPKYPKPRGNAFTLGRTDSLEARRAASEKGPGLDTIALAQSNGSADLDSKLTQQLMEFEKSLSTEPDKICRRFSIEDFNSEKDIVWGSSKLLAPQELSRRRKALRPPPPRPSTPTSTPLHTLIDQNPRPQLPFPMRPSRPAPLPPSMQQRVSVVPTKIPASPQPSSESLEQQGPETVEKTLDHPSQDPLVTTVRIQEMEQDLDMYSPAPEELNLLLEKQEATFKADTLGNLQFYESNIESVSLELQQLRGK